MSLLQNLAPAFARSATTTDQNDDLADTATVRPVYNLNETADAYSATVQLPGVAKDGLEITSEDGTLTIVGRRSWKRPEGWTPVYRETGEVTYRLVLRHNDAVDVAKVQAEIRDGVLRITLPKSEAAKPRKIAVS